MAGYVKRISVDFIWRLSAADCAFVSGDIGFYSGAKPEANFGNPERSIVRLN